MKKQTVKQKQRLKKERDRDALLRVLVMNSVEHAVWEIAMKNYLVSLPAGAAFCEAGFQERLELWRESFRTYRDTLRKASYREIAEMIATPRDRPARPGDPPSSFDASKLAVNPSPRPKLAIVPKKRKTAPAPKK